MRHTLTLKAQGILGFLWSRSTCGNLRYSGTTGRRIWRKLWDGTEETEEDRGGQRRQRRRAAVTKSIISIVDSSQSHTLVCSFIFQLCLQVTHYCLAIVIIVLHSVSLLSAAVGHSLIFFFFRDSKQASSQALLSLCIIVRQGLDFSFKLRCNEADSRYNITEILCYITSHVI